MMSLSVVVPPAPLADSVYGPPAAIAGMLARQWPCASALASAVLPPRLTATPSPGAAVPHTVKASPRCSTAWSPKMPANAGAPGTGVASDATSTKAAMLMPFSSRNFQGAGVRQGGHIGRQRDLQAQRGLFERQRTLDTEQLDPPDAARQVRTGAAHGLDRHPARCRPAHDEGEHSLTLGE